MNKPRRTSFVMSLALAVLLGVTASGDAFAQRSGVHARAGARTYAAPHQHIDGRYSNYRPYYNRGYAVRALPRGAYRELRGPHGGRYGYHGGNWYRWNGRAWVIWGAPLGVYVPWLPPYFTTIWWYGIPYYYANDTYYVWNADRSAYQVVAPPSDIDRSATTQAPASDRLFAYPDRGQSEAQQKDDRYACHRWAVDQTGFDPTQPQQGLSTDSLTRKHDDYLRAQAACLEARGYTVR